MVGIDQVASVLSSADVTQPCRHHHAVAKHLKTESADSGDHSSSVIVHCAPKGWNARTGGQDGSSSTKQNQVIRLVKPTNGPRLL